MGFIKLEVAEDGGRGRRRTRRALTTDLQVEVGIAGIAVCRRRRSAALDTERRGEARRASAHRLELAEGAARGHHRLAHILQELARSHPRNRRVRLGRCGRTKHIYSTVGRKGGAYKRTARVRAGGSERVDIGAGVTQVSHNDEMRTATLVPASTRRKSTRVHFILYT